MPRRTTQSTALSTPAASTPLRDTSALLSIDDPFHADVSLLRRQWKWAAFSQFFYTFATLLAMSDVSLTDVEYDLTRSTSIVLPRIMVRLLYTLSPDRRLSLDNWQTSLRKQYYKRDPQANPIGPEPVVYTGSPSPEPSEKQLPHDSDDAKKEREQSAEPSIDAKPAYGQADRAESSVAPDVTSTKEPTVELTFSRADTELQSIKEETRPSSMEKAGPDSSQESKDWLQLPMLEKLDSLWLLTEWQFQKPLRVRQLMKDDDETAQWRIEPIGYDSKANAYWLIGPDRLWLQRVPPRPPRSLKRKRSGAAKSKKAKRTAPADEEEFASDTVPSPKKRKAAPAAAPAQPKTPPRSTRTRKQATTAAEETPSGRGSRAAKTQANLKLDKQAKELAELKRQAAMESKQRNGRRGSGVGLGAEAEGEEGSASRSSPRKRRAAPTSTAVGTRLSARLRGARDAEEVWQEVPDEWLMEGVESTGEGEAEKVAENGKSKGKGRATHDAVAPIVPKTGLESDDNSVSELTELSDQSPSDQEEAAAAPVASTSKKAANGKGGRQSARSKKAAKKAPEPEEPEEPEYADEPAEELEPEWRPPDDFVEWETLCVTLYDWEHITERFEKATHYAEKALYKVLSQHIVPAITAELREIERKRRLEEAVTHRKRSSRLAIRETEKEEARLAAQRKAEEEEKLSRARRLEARIKKEEEEREKREHAREKRRKEREEREARNRQRQEQRPDDVASSSVGTPIDVEDDDKPSRSRKAARPSASAKANGSTSGSRTPPSTEDWELDCEICYRRGINKDDGRPLVCCGKCNKWQHIACHDYADRVAGLPKRKWDIEEFVCAQCRTGVYPGPPPNGHRQVYPTAHPAIPGYAQPGNPGQAGYAGHAQPSSYARGDTSHEPPVVPSRSHAAITFTHYQPQQHGFSKTQPTQIQPYPMGQSYPGAGYGIGQDGSSRGVPQYHNVSDTRSMGHAATSSQPQFVARPYVPNGASWTSPAVPAQPPMSAAWNAAPTNGYGHYNPSAERSSAAGPPYEHAVPNAGMAVPIQDATRAHPYSSPQPQPQPQLNNNRSAFPSSHEQYSYSPGPVPPPQQHRAP